MRNGGENIERFMSDGFLSIGLLMRHGAHVVQSIGKFNNHHADVLAHGKNHFACRFRFLLLAVGKIEFVELGHTIHHDGNLFAKFLADGFVGDAVAILHSVVQNACRNGGGINHDVG